LRFKIENGQHLERDKVTAIEYESPPNPIHASVVKTALLAMTCWECFPALQLVHI